MSIENDQNVNVRHSAGSTLESARLATNVLRSTSKTVGTEDDKVEVQTTIDMNGNVLKGAVIRDSALNDLDEMGVTWLTVRGAAPSRLAAFTAACRHPSTPLDARATRDAMNASHDAVQVRARRDDARRDARDAR